MLIGDLTFRTLAAAAETDQESALHSPIIMRGLVHGYAASQALAVRRLVDKTKKTISIRKLLDDIRNQIHLITRENYVSGQGVSYVSDEAFLAHAMFDQLAGTQPESRDRGDRIPKRLINTIETWCNVKEISEVVAWCDNCIAHSADEASHQGINFAALVPTMGKMATAQRHIVRAAEAVSVYFLRFPAHLSVVPVFQYSQFTHFKTAVSDPQAVKKAQDRWHELADDRDRWTDGLLEQLLA
jgi:hypothetical protein